MQPGVLVAPMPQIRSTIVTIKGPLEKSSWSFPPIREFHRGWNILFRQGEHVVSYARQMAVEQAARGLGIALLQCGDYGTVVPVILLAAPFGQAALLQAVPSGLVSGRVNGLAAVDQQCVLGRPKDRQMQPGVPMLASEIFIWE